MAHKQLSVEEREEIQKGDKVLIYSASQKAILYSPSLNKIVEIAPVNTGNSGAPTNSPL